jgi:hypothetical protein
MRRKAKQLLYLRETSRKKALDSFACFISARAVERRNGRELVSVPWFRVSSSSAGGTMKDVETAMSRIGAVVVSAAYATYISMRTHSDPPPIPSVDWDSQLIFFQASEL